MALDVTTVYYQGNAVPALLLPFCDGITMASWLQMQPPLSSRIVVLHKLLRALAGLHDAGLAHNDLSLGNVMIGAETITLIDFDRAQPADVHQARAIPPPESAPSTTSAASDEQLICARSHSDLYC
ncbi:MAG: phosphotransferase [Gammaproteobacteria bacterium]